VRIRDAKAADAPILEALQRRSSDVWEQYRRQLTAHPEAIELSPSFIDNSCRPCISHRRGVYGSDCRPAKGFYERVGFAVIGDRQTRFGPAVRMRYELPR
jgi:hypothetical protein